MKRTGNSAFFYGVILLLAFALSALLLHQGSRLEVATQSQNPAQTTTSTANAGSVSAGNVNISQPWYLTILHHMQKPPGITLLQLILVILAARFFAGLAHRIRQPGVIGEMVAGIVLGPSLLGWFFPAYLDAVFPASSLAILQSLSQLGLVLFMFVVGMELDLSHLRHRTHEAVLISHASIIFPFLLGMSLALFLFRPYSPVGVGFVPFALFLGIAMSVTAFPVLARIIQEKGISSTPFGAIVLTAAAVDDVTAWSLLAVIVAIVNSTGIDQTAITLLLLVIYILTMLYIVRPILARAASIYVNQDVFTRGVVSYMMVIVFISALFTEIAGVHALFGAFLAGAIMPGGHKFKSQLTMRIEDLSLSVLMPLFFALTGLRTSINLIGSGESLFALFAIVGVAIAGKFGGSLIAARWSGMNWFESSRIGILMNTRGLMELIVLNIGFDLGVLSKEIFTIMVLMTLITTFMTGPVLHLLEHFSSGTDKKSATELSIGPLPSVGEFKILLPFGPSKNGVRLLKMLACLQGANEKAESEKTYITALHLSPSSYRTKPDLEKTRRIFQPILHTASRLGLAVHTLHLQTPDVARTIVQVANEQKDDYIILGSARSLFSRSIIGGTVGRILRDAECGVAVYVDRSSKKPEDIIIVYNGTEDRFLLDLGKRFAVGCASQIRIFYGRERPPSDSIMELHLDMEKDCLPWEGRTFVASKPSLLLVSTGAFEELLDSQGLDPSRGKDCSLLIVRNAHKNTVG